MIRNTLVVIVTYEAQAASKLTPTHQLELLTQLAAHTKCGEFCLECFKTNRTGATYLPGTGKRESDLMRESREICPTADPTTNAATRR